MIFCLEPHGFELGHKKLSVIGPERATNFQNLMASYLAMFLPENNSDLSSEKVLVMNSISLRFFQFNQQLLVISMGPLVGITETHYKYNIQNVFSFAVCLEL